MLAKISTIENSLFTKYFKHTTNTSNHYKWKTGHRKGIHTIIVVNMQCAMCKVYTLCIKCRIAVEFTLFIQIPNSWTLCKRAPFLGVSHPLPISPSVCMLYHLTRRISNFSDIHIGYKQSKCSICMVSGCSVVSAICQKFRSKCTIGNFNSKYLIRFFLFGGSHLRFCHFLYAWHGKIENHYKTQRNNLQTNNNNIWP